MSGPGRAVNGASGSGGDRDGDDGGGDNAPATGERPTPGRLRRILLLGVAVWAAIAAILAVRNWLVDDPLTVLQRSERAGAATVYTGQWHFPRGGPYILGFAAPGAARLWVDDRLVASGRGQRLGRHVFAPGVYAVRFETPADAVPGQGLRLLWHPPGRRGPPEYVPPSSLAPPDTAERSAAFGPWAGTAIVDGICATAIALLLLAWLLYLAAPAIKRALAHGPSRRIWASAALMAVLALGVRLWDLGGAGQTWDEDVNWSAGRNYITNLLALDFSSASWQWNYEHPPIMKYIAGLGAQWADGYGPARALSALLSALAVALLVPIGAHLYSARVGVWAAIIAALSPHLIAHGKVVGHEAPTVFFWSLGLWLTLRAASPPLPVPQIWTSPGRLARLWAILGIVVGLATFSRFINGLLGVLIAITLLLSAWARTRDQRALLRIALIGLAVAIPVAVLVGTLTWPRLWDAPFVHLQQSLAKLSRPHSAEPFLGTITNTPPPYYFAVYLLVTAPIAVVAATAAWMVRALWDLVASRRTGLSPQRWRAHLVVLAWLLVPLAVAFSPVRQDGVRYIMPSLLALSLAAAAGMDAVAGALWARIRAPGKSDAGGTITVAGAAVMGIYLAVVCARIHPYYLNYYGEHVGGPKTVAAKRWFEVAWWGEGIHEAIDYVNTHAETGARVHKRCVEPSHLTWLRTDLWARQAQRPADADWLISYQSGWRPCPVPDHLELVFEVAAQGAPLSRVYRRRDTP